MKITVYECDRCEALTKIERDMYVLTLESVGWAGCPAGGPSEKSFVIQHFCRRCADHIAEAVEFLYKKAKMESK